MGCLKKIGCLAVIILAFAAGFIGRGLWLPRIRQPSATSVAAQGWQPLTAEGGLRAQRFIEQLANPAGPPSVRVSPSELAAYVLQQLSGAIPETADSVQATAMGDRLCVRAIVPVKDIADDKALGPLAMLLGDREPVRLCGTIRIHSPGVGEFQVKEFRFRELGLPGPVIPRIIKQMSAGMDRPEGMSDDGLPLATPTRVADVRVVDGQVVISKTAGP